MSAFLMKIIYKNNNNENTNVFGMKYVNLGINQMKL